MSKLRSLRKLATAVTISSGHTITSGDAAFRSSIFLGAMSLIAGTQDHETIRNICMEAARRGRLISDSTARDGP
ncbi:MAG: hypothetical protein PHT35_09025 [Bacteroidales bacterium]|nr:hypothetical protein [Bacteroidales bacterium]MDD4436367.1 hypothetical protein [Bacteroidales bacterium]